MGNIGEETKELAHIAIVPTPGIGHLFPLIALAKRVVTQHNLGVIFIIPNDGSSSSIEIQTELLSSLPKLITYAFLPAVNLNDIPSQDATIETRMESTLIRSLPALRDKLQSMNVRISALVVDLFGPCAFELSHQLGISPYIFFPTNALVLSFFFHLPELDEMTCSDTPYCDLTEPIKLFGCPPIHGRDLFSPLHDRRSLTYKSFLKMAKLYKHARGIMVNSFSELQPLTFLAFNQCLYDNPPVYPLGPLTQTEDNDSDNDNDACLSWLDKQPSGSVLFVSFGSGGTLSAEQFTELALGLEKSGQRFVWVVKSPNDTSSDSAYFSLKTAKDPFQYLPEGYVERNKEKGMLIDCWAPQMRILAHPSTGGFLTHCGWNSTLESIMNGMPLIAWPLYAEQRMNSVILGQDNLKVALRVEFDDIERGIVGSQQIADRVIELIRGEEGKLMRKRMNELKESANIALGNQGSSTQSLAHLVSVWKSHNH